MDCRTTQPRQLIKARGAGAVAHGKTHQRRGQGRVRLFRGRRRRCLLDSGSRVHRVHGGQAGLRVMQLLLQGCNRLFRGSSARCGGLGVANCSGASLLKSRRLLLRRGERGFSHRRALHCIFQLLLNVHLRRPERGRGARGFCQGFGKSSARESRTDAPCALLSSDMAASNACRSEASRPDDQVAPRRMSCRGKPVKPWYATQTPSAACAAHPVHDLVHVVGIAARGAAAQILGARQGAGERQGTASVQARAPVAHAERALRGARSKRVRGAGAPSR